jgi:MoaA/NifB/PqqE/SkfB family radical SAM enzyme
MRFFLSPNAHVVLQPYGSFLCSRRINRFDIVDRVGTALVLALTSPSTKDDLIELVTQVMPNIRSESVTSFVNFLIDSGYVLQIQDGQATATGTISFEHDPEILKAVRSEIEITNRCNLRCRYCYAEVNSSKLKLSLKDWASILERMIAHGLRAVLFSGGEPFLYEQFLDLVEWCADRLIVEINTNGSYINPEVASHLGCLNLKGIHVSVDSHTREYHDSVRGTGSYAAAINAVRALVAAHVPVEVSAVVTKRNRETVGFLSDLARSLGAGFNAALVTRTGFAKAIPDSEWKRDFLLVSATDAVAHGADGDLGLSHLPFPRLCQAQFGYVSISHMGTLKPCNMPESFFAQSARRLILDGSSRWWERFYGECRLGQSSASVPEPIVLPSERPPARSSSTDATSDSQRCMRSPGLASREC